MADVSNRQDSAQNFHHTDGYGTAVRDTHFSGGTPLEQLARLAGQFFSGKLPDGGYGGAQQGDAITGSGITIRSGPGTVVTKNPDGTTTVTKITSGDTKTVLKFNESGELVDTKTVSIKTNADGELIQRIVHADGTVQNINLSAYVDGEGEPNVYWDHKTGQATIVSFSEPGSNDKTVVKVDEDGSIIYYKEYKYEISLEGDIVERYFDLNGQEYIRTIVKNEEEDLASSIEVTDRGLVYASTTRSDGSKEIVVLSADSGDATATKLIFETKPDGSVIQWTIDHAGNRYSDVLIPASEGAGMPTMEVSLTCVVTFTVARSDGSQTDLHVDARGDVFSGGMLTYETRPDGSCTLKYVDAITGSVHTSG